VRGKKWEPAYRLAGSPFDLNLHRDWEKRYRQDCPKIQKVFLKKIGHNDERVIISCRFHFVFEQDDSTLIVSSYKILQ
jgi:hypothetical protein